MSLVLISEREGKTGANRFDDEIKRGKISLLSRRLDINSLKILGVHCNCSKQLFYRSYDCRAIQKICLRSRAGSNERYE